MMQADSTVGAGSMALHERCPAGRRGDARPALERLFALGVALMLALMMPAHSQAQSYGVPPDLEAPSAEFLPQDQLDALLAPIALYPDELLAQVLMASTYPLEVVEAARFVQQNPGLTGAALDDALRGKPWDPSVQSLAAFPQVLAMMSERLEWTQQLGDSFLANRQQVMDTVQGLRARAEATGTLQDSDQQRVTTEDQAIVIEPAQPDYVYVPVYDPLLAYGPWWVASYQPFFWYPPAFYGYPVFQINTVIVWGRPCHVGRNHWGWAHPEWRAGRIAMTVGRNVFFNRPQYRNDRRGSVTWQHAPEHRRGVAYGSALVRDRYVNVERRAAQARRELRAGVQSPALGRQAAVPRATLATPQTARAYPYRQVPPNVRGTPALRPAPPRVQAQPRVAPPPSMPRMIVAAPQAAPAPSLPRVIIAAPQAAPAPPAAYAPVPAERGRVVRQRAAPAEAGDSGGPRGR